MKVITSTVPEIHYQECCPECGSALVNYRNREYVCEDCGIVPEDGPFDFHETRADYRWRQEYRERYRSINRRKNKTVEGYYRYKVLKTKIKRSYQRSDREKLFYGEIARLCGQLELPSVVLRDAELYGEKILEKIPPYTHFDSILAAATALVWGCTFIGEKCYSPRTFQEIMSVSHTEVSRKDVFQAANNYVFTYLVKNAPNMVENKQYANLVNYYIEHFGAVLKVPIKTILMAKALFEHLECKQYTIKPDVQSIALLQYTYTHQSRVKKVILAEEFSESQKQTQEVVMNKISTISGYEKGHELRSQIVDLLSRNPNLDLNEIAKGVQKPYHTTYYHVQKLKKLGILAEDQKRSKGPGRPKIVFSLKSKDSDNKKPEKQSKLHYHKEETEHIPSNSDNTQLDWKMISEKCFTSTLSSKRIIRDICSDLEKENEFCVN